MVRACHVNAINKLEKTDSDSETYGLIICKDSDNYVARTTLDNVNMQLSISKYKILEELPKYLEKRLNLGLKI